MGLRSSALAAAICCVACAEAGPLSPAKQVAERGWFLPSVARELDAAGRLPGTRPPRSNDSEISAERAGELADKFFGAFGTALEPWWTRFAGRPIRASALSRCRRIDFVEHPYEALPSDASEFFRANYGSQWLVRYCERGDVLAAEIYVSAEALGMSLDSLGEFRANVPLSNFWTTGIRLNLSVTESSESAARAAFLRVPDPIAEIPRMIRLSRNWAPSVISWVVTQSSSAGVRTSVMALPKGTPTAWVLRQIGPTPPEIDSLVDVGVTPAVMRMLRRRGEAATSQEMPQ